MCDVANFYTFTEAFEFVCKNMQTSTTITCGASIWKPTVARTNIWGSEEIGTEAMCESWEAWDVLEPFEISMESMPYDLLLTILEFTADLKQLTWYSRVCKTWNQVLSSSISFSLWKRAFTMHVVPECSSLEFDSDCSSDFGEPPEDDVYEITGSNYNRSTGEFEYEYDLVERPEVVVRVKPPKSDIGVFLRCRNSQWSQCELAMFAQEACEDRYGTELSARQRQKYDFDGYGFESISIRASNTGSYETAIKCIRLFRQFSKFSVDQLCRRGDTFNMIRSLFRSLASDPKYEKYSEVFIRLNNDYISHELPFSKFEMLVNFITAVIRGESDENIDEMHAAIYAVATVQPCGAAVALPCDGAAVALPCDEAAVALPRDEAAAAQPRDGAAAAQPRDEESDDSDATEIYNDDDGFIAAVIEAQRSLDAQFPNV